MVLIEKDGWTLSLAEKNNVLKVISISTIAGNGHSVRDGINVSPVRALFLI